MWKSHWKKEAYIIGYNEIYVILTFIKLHQYSFQVNSSLNETFIKVGKYKKKIMWNWNDSSQLGDHFRFLDFKTVNFTEN